ncbi:hypothetical protein Nepgr_007643 [Nepenthes gracilis]|uniref:Uncharacterized protein n=1 Tax=Nepenthes gracilis TaxID=150966 RepID=A0AAD3XIH4_NEPGR|nr:hypothetical protein Nepgr_007643 [Nepenthes gracilis]
MAGIAILLELLRKNPKFDPTQTPHCFGYLPAKVAISAAAAASVAATYPFGFRVFISNAGISVAHCDAAPAWSTDPNIHNIPGYVFESDSLIYSSKVYNIEVKVPFSAFQRKVLAVTTLRSFLLNY